jgi:hypothetical protein
MAERLGIEQSRVSRMTASAIRARLVKRIASQSDGRRSHVELTSEGFKALEIVRRFRTAVFAQIMSDWSDRECLEFGNLLIRFTDSLADVFGTDTIPQDRRRSRRPGGITLKKKGRNDSRRSRRRMPT